MFLIVSIGFSCGLKINAQSFKNDIALFTSERDFSFAVSEKTVETPASEVSAADLKIFINKKQKVKAVLGYTKENRPVEVYYFPGTGNKKALIVGGMHGSELSSIEVARNIIKILSKDVTPYYDVLIIPSLFPDNAVAASQVLEKKPVVNFGRYSSAVSADPNRQMPCLGKEFDASKPVDFYGRLIERENQYLLQLVKDYKPARIANLHAIRDITKAGIYADPRTDCKGVALGFASDSTLAVSIAKLIGDNGGWIAGNDLLNNPTALYYHDPEIAGEGTLQKRNLHGSPLPHNRGYGVSLGGWAATAVCNEKDSVSRNAIRLITVEFPGYKNSSSYSDEEQKNNCLSNVQLYSMAIVKIFLGKTCEEN